MSSEAYSYGSLDYSTGAQYDDVFDEDDDYEEEKPPSPTKMHDVPRCARNGRTACERYQAQGYVKDCPCTCHKLAPERRLAFRSRGKKS